MYIRDFSEFQRQEEFRNHIERDRKLADHGRGMESLDITRCPHCERPTVVEEHVYTPQRKLFGDDREETYFTCEWCGAEVEPNEATPRKPAQSEIAESENDRRRRA